jgi:hypothetical protein
MSSTWKELAARLVKAGNHDLDLNQRLFAAVHGWTYPLAGAALQEYEAIGRESGRNDFTGDTDSAFRLAERFSESRPSFKMERDGDGHAKVTMSVGVYNAFEKADVVCEVRGASSTVARAVCVCVCEAGHKQATWSELAGN